jgi:YaiO family outer membrane protein
MRIKREDFIIAFLSVLAVCSPPGSYAAEQTETERLIRSITPPESVVKDEVRKKDQFYFDSYYEPSLVLQGNRTGRWSELTNTFGYTHENVQGYFFVTEYDRLGVNNYTANLGSYLSFKDSYAHIEAGFGWDTTYIYNFQTIAEYGHKIIKNLYGQIGYTYRAYHVSGDVHNVYPSLIYYFGDHNISANYGVSWIESREPSSFGIVKGNFKITKFLSYYLGTAFGQRLYDIFAISATKEKGYIVFTGVIINLNKNITARVGCGYGTEEPKFIKRSLNFGLTAKF